MIVCSCKVVRADEIRTEVRLGAETVELVAERCGAASKCGNCADAVNCLILDEMTRMVEGTPLAS